MDDDVVVVENRTCGAVIRMHGESQMFSYGTGLDVLSQVFSYVTGLDVL